MQNSFNWIAISSTVGIDKLFFERDYWIYFVLVPQNHVVMVKEYPFLKKQMQFSADDEFITNLNQWMKYTKCISKGSTLKLLPKIQLKFPTPHISQSENVAYSVDMTFAVPPFNLQKINKL